MRDRRIWRRILTLVLTLCMIFTEWGAYSFTANAASSTLAISGASYPTTIKQGSSWTCKGTISSNFNLSQIGGYILGSDGSTILYSKIVHPNKKSYSLQNSEVDKALLFNKLSAGSFYYKITAKDTSGKNLTLVNTKFTVQGNTSSLKISGQSTPGTLNQGSSWTCTGKITSNYNINQVGGYILASDESTVIYSKTVQPNAKSYTLQNSAIDKALLFNKLSAGTFCYKITAQDVSGNKQTLVNVKFTVKGKEASTLKISNAGTPGTLNKGSSWTCTGTISSNYVITNVTGYILNSNGSTKYSKSVAPNKTSYTLTNSAIDSALKFNSLNVGTYIYKITATDKSGKTLTLVQNNFTVTQPASTLKISGAGTIDTLTKGQSWSCTGTVSSNYNITKIIGTIYASNGVTKKYSKTVTPKKTSFSLQNSAIDKALYFNKLAVGSYYYTISATDASGKTATLVNQKFEVKKVTEKTYSLPYKSGVSWYVSQNYGNTGAGSSGHRGVDLAANGGTAIYAIADGTVCKVYKKNGEASYGNYVIIKHSDNKYSLYAHMQDNSIKVKVGDKVQKGKTLIGKVGMTGTATGNHLHLEISTKAPDDWKSGGAGFNRDYLLNPRDWVTGL